MVEQNISTLDQGEDALALSSASEDHGIFRDNGTCDTGFAKPLTSSSGEPGLWYSLSPLRGHAMSSFLDLRPDTYLDSPAYQRPATEQLLARLSEWYSGLWLGGINTGRGRGLEKRSQLCWPRYHLPKHSSKVSRSFALETCPLEYYNSVLV